MQTIFRSFYENQIFFQSHDNNCHLSELSLENRLLVLIKGFVDAVDGVIISELSESWRLSNGR